MYWVVSASAMPTTRPAITAAERAVEATEGRCGKRVHEDGGHQTGVEAGRAGCDE